MCGIFGNLLKDTSLNIDENKLRLLEVKKNLEHRGPDDSGIEFFDIIDKNSGSKSFLSLGHTRLSIIDLSDKGHQPMRSNDNRFIISYNGEIYNYKELRNELQSKGHIFRSESDTEVLLAVWSEWGIKGLQRLVGMFAFVVYDSVKQNITLVRDAFGIKPIFYKIDNNSIYFASELPALLKLIPEKPNLDLQKSYDYLVHNDYDSGSGTFIDGVQQLSPANYLVFDLKSFIASEPQAWWTPDLKTRTKLSFEESANKLRELFLESIKLHLRSDVPIGITLSGGIDSSAIASSVRYLYPNMPINTFSFIAEDQNISEEHWIDNLNKKINATSHKIRINNNDIRSDLTEMIKKQGEPFGSTSIYAQYRVSKMIQEKGITVILDGQGADEILAGYRGYPGHRLLSLIEQNKWIQAHQFAKHWASLNKRNYLLAWMHLGRITLPNFLYELINKFFSMLPRNKIGKNFNPKWINVNFLKKMNIRLQENRMNFNKNNSGQRVKEVLAHSLIKQGLPSLLRHADRNSMAFSIESRVPYLTIPLVSFLFSLPEDYLISEKGITKYIFRKAMRGIVPDDILDRTDKIAFTTPEHTWIISIAKNVKQFLSSYIALPIINMDELTKELDKSINQKKIDDGRTWRWINFLYWSNIFINPKSNQK